MPALTAPQLIEQLNRQKRVTPGIVLNNSTVYRFLHQQNLMGPQMKKPVDRRKFEAELPNDLWQSDVMHDPKVDVDAKMRKTLKRDALKIFNRKGFRELINAKPCQD